MRAAFEIREFDERSDLGAVISCYESGFGRTEWPFFKYSSASALEDLVLTDYRSSDIALVAEADGEARGVLLASVSSGWAGFVRELSLLAGLIWRRFVANRDEMRPLARACLRRALIAEIGYYLRAPGGPSAEIITLASQDAYRGGIGRALVDALVDEARSRGCPRIDVGTDSEVSWGFYEAYGFKRVREFNTHVYDYSLPDADVSTYIYSLDIGHGRAEGSSC